jgi:hypothetical protein
VRTKARRPCLNKFTWKPFSSVALLLFITQTTSLMLLSENKKHEEGGELEFGAVEEYHREWICGKTWIQGLGRMGGGSDGGRWCARSF